MRQSKGSVLQIGVPNNRFFRGQSFESWRGWVSMVLLLQYLEQRRVCRDFHEVESGYPGPDLAKSSAPTSALYEGLAPLHDRGGTRQ